MKIFHRNLSRFLYWLSWYILSACPNQQRQGWLLLFLISNVSFLILILAQMQVSLLFVHTFLYSLFLQDKARKCFANCSLLFFHTGKFLCSLQGVSIFYFLWITQVFFQFSLQVWLHCSQKSTTIHPWQAWYNVHFHHGFPDRHKLSHFVLFVKNAASMFHQLSLHYLG